MSKLDYNPETGVFKWKETSRRGFVGKEAGCFCQRDGYIRIRVDGKLELTHRLAWNITYPNAPVTSSEQIDHINHVRTDNRIANLRKATNTENSRNASIGAIQPKAAFDLTKNPGSEWADSNPRMQIAETSWPVRYL